jgi:serine/threonine-protein kinase
MARLLSVLWFTTVALVGSAVASDWATYVNDRFGTTAGIPAGYKAGEAPENGDGLRFTSPEGDATIAVWGGFATVTDENFVGYAKRRVSYEKDDGWTVTYSAGKKDWYAFSGSNADRIFFEKIIQACNGEIANHVRLEYPATRQCEFDPIVAHVAKSLRSERGWQC